MARTRARSTPPKASRKARKKRQSERIPTIADSVNAKLRELTSLGHVREAGTKPISIALTHLQVFRNLSERQQQTLSELVTELYAQGHAVKWFAEQQRERKQWTDEGPKRLKTLQSKISRARTAVDALIDYLTTVGIDDAEVSSILSQALRILDSTRLPDATTLTALLGPSTPAESAMVTLYDFFKGCGLENAEAEVRVCQVGNYLWEWNVAVTERYSGHGEDWKGCAAVRKAIARRRRTTDTSPPNH
jgi:hypothetical protein